MLCLFKLSSRLTSQPLNAGADQHMRGSVNKPPVLGSCACNVAYKTRARVVNLPLCRLTNTMWRRTLELLRSVLNTVNECMVEGTCCCNYIIFIHLTGVQSSLEKGDSALWVCRFRSAMFSTESTPHWMKPLLYPYDLIWFSFAVVFKKKRIALFDTTNVPIN